MEEKYSWTGTVSAPEEYPIEVYSGAIRAVDFTYTFDAIWGTQNTGWGNAGGIMSVEQERMAAPDSLDFTWLSLVEKKFYTGKWKLDRERIEKLFREGYMNNMSNKKETYTQIKVGLAPKGMVQVWLSGAGFQTEVGTFAAHDTVITADKAYDNALYMFKPGYAERTLTDTSVVPAEVQARIAKSEFRAPEMFRQYNSRYKWRPSLIVASGGKPSLYYYHFLNGEEETRFGAELAENRHLERACPKKLSCQWTDAGGKRHGIDISFSDETETMKAFSSLGSQGNVDLVITIDSRASGATVVLRNRTAEVALKAQTRITQNID